MTHREEGELQAYLDGELPEGVAHEVRAHLEACTACRSSLDDLRARADLVTGALAAVDGTPDLDAARWEVRRRWAARRSQARRQWSMRAAAVIVLVSGVVAASLPGSPVRAVMSEGWDRVTAYVMGPEEEPAEVTPPVEEADEPEEVEDEPATGRVATEAGPEGLDVRLEGVEEGVEVEVVRVSGRMGALEVTGEYGGFGSAEGMLTVRVDEGTVRVELPDGAPMARVLLEGEVLVELADGRFDAPGRQPDDEGDGTVTFRF